MPTKSGNRIGLIARADSRGLGIQTHEFYRHMQPAKTMVIDCPSAKPLPLRRDWYPDATWINGLPKERDFIDWLPGLDAVYTAETPYSHTLFSAAKRIGVKTVLHVNPEFLDHIRKAYLPKPSVFACPTRWMWDRIPEPKILLPTPVDVERFQPANADKATNFLHIIGRPAIHDRAGTMTTLLALEHVRTPIKLTITCQEPGYVKAMILDVGIRIPGHIELRIIDTDFENYWDLYEGHHVLVSPRRFGGQSLPMQEACAAGMPVIAPAVSPNTDWLPSDWLTPAQHAGTFTAHTEVELYTADVRSVADKIEQFATDDDYYRNANAQALAIAKQLSWENLKPDYEKALRGR